MTNSLLKAAGITTDTKGHSAERELFNAAWACVEQLRYNHRYQPRNSWRRRCCDTPMDFPHIDNCPLVTFDKAAKHFQEDV